MFIYTDGFFTFQYFSYITYGIQFNICYSSTANTVSVNTPFTDLNKETVVLKARVLNYLLRSTEKAWAFNLLYQTPASTQACRAFYLSFLFLL